MAAREHLKALEIAREVVNGRRPTTSRTSWSRSTGWPRSSMRPIRSRPGRACQARRPRRPTSAACTSPTASAGARGCHRRAVALRAGTARPHPRVSSRCHERRRHSSADGRLVRPRWRTPDGDVDPRRVGDQGRQPHAHGRRPACPFRPGFVLGTDVCADYHAAGERLGERRDRALIGVGHPHIEQATGRRFGGRRRPLLVAVRSGAAASMPGMLDTMLNVGLCDVTAAGAPAGHRRPGLRLGLLPAAHPSPTRRSSRAARPRRSPPCSTTLPAPRRVYPSSASSTLPHCRSLSRRYLQVYPVEVGRPFPQDPMEQLLGAVEAVLRSWNAPRAVEYRRLQGLTDLGGTAVTVQAMVFGNTRRHVGIRGRVHPRPRDVARTGSTSTSSSTPG